MKLRLLALIAILALPLPSSARSRCGDLGCYDSLLAPDFAIKNGPGMGCRMEFVEEAKDCPKGYHCGMMGLVCTVRR